MTINYTVFDRYRNLIPAGTGRGWLSFRLKSNIFRPGPDEFKISNKFSLFHLQFKWSMFHRFDSVHK